MDDHMPDLAHAKTWLTEMRADLLLARTNVVVEGAGDHVDDDLIPDRIANAQALQQMLDKHAATLEDIIARADITPKRASARGALSELSDALDEYDRAIIQKGDTAAAARDAANRAAEFLAEHPRLAQAIALHRRVTRAQFSTVQPNPFDLPAGYLLVVEDPNQHPFTCGIAPDGAVSS